jgi:uncharacterized membrane protein
MRNREDSVRQSAQILSALLASATIFAALLAGPVLVTRLLHTSIPEPLGWLALGLALVSGLALTGMFRRPR